MLALIFRYAACMMLGLCIGGIVAGEFALGDTLVSMALVVVVIGGLSKVFGRMFGSKELKWADAKEKKILTYLIAFAIGFAAFFGGW